MFGRDVEEVNMMWGILCKDYYDINTIKTKDKVDSNDKTLCIGSNTCT